MAEKFEVGQIVQLKSGGPKMTVTGASDGKKDVECTWFAGAKKEYGWFPTGSLVRVPDETKPQ